MAGKDTKTMENKIVMIWRLANKEKGETEKKEVSCLKWKSRGSMAEGRGVT